MPRRSRMTQAAEMMLQELGLMRLHVIKKKTEHGYTRLAVATNPQWYRRFCRDHSRTRRRYSKLKTYIKRCWTMRALERIVEGVRTGVYVQRLMPYVYDYPVPRSNAAQRRRLKQLRQIPF